MDGANQYVSQGAVNELECPAGTFNIMDANNTVTGECKYCGSGTQYLAKNMACTDCPVGKFQDSNSVAGVTCSPCDRNKETQVAGIHTTTGANDCVACGLGHFSFQWKCIPLVCHCDNGPAAVGAEVSGNWP